PSCRLISKPMPRLAPVTRATRSTSVDVQHGLAGDLAVGQRADGVAGLAPADLEVDLGVELAGGDERRQSAQRQPRATALVELVEDKEAVEARAGRAAEERPSRELGRGRVAARERDDRPVERDALQRGAEARAGA